MSLVRRQGRNQVYRDMAPFMGALRRNFRKRIGTARATSFSRSRTMTKQKRRVYSGQGITTQHDQRRIYTKRSMPRRKRRQWKSFVRRVHAVAEKELGSRTVLFNKSIQYSNTTSGNQISGAIYLYGKAASGDTHARDLFNIISGENLGDYTAALGANVDQSTKLLFQSGILDVTFKNNSTITTTGPIVSSASEAKLEVDVYEILVRKSTGDFITNYDQFEDLLDRNVTDTKPIANVGTEVAHTLRGVTPFDLTFSLGRFGIKILKKTKYVVPNNDTFTYQVRDPSRRTSTISKLNSAEGFNMPGWTRVIYFTGKLVPGLTVGAGIATYQENLIIGATRKYFYKVEGSNDERTRYYQNT